MAFRCIAGRKIGAWAGDALPSRRACHADHQVDTSLGDLIEMGDCLKIIRSLSHIIHQEFVTITSKNQYINDINIIYQPRKCQK
jgi:hypothetical protein